MLIDRSIKELSEGLKKRDFSSEEIVREAYENIEKFNRNINAFITVVEKEQAIKLAQKKDKKISAKVSPLYGLPFVLKDSYLTSGILTTAASKVLGNYIGQYDATVYQKLLDAGGILIGKMNMDAWGHGGSSENTDFGVVKNPWDKTRVAGGSSGGPAAAIASRMAVFAIGEDTGGSIRNPAAWCNISGLKVTYGRVSRYGCIAYASSFDTVGPMAKTSEDCAFVLQNIAGIDPMDATSSPNPVPNYIEEISRDIDKLVIGFPKEFYTEGLDSEIKKKIEEAVKVFTELGLEVREISMPILEMSIPVYYLIAPSETSSNLARYDGIRYGNTRGDFTRETMRRIMLGTYALSAGYYDAYYKKAQQVRTLFVKEYEKALNKCDVILMPVNPTSSPKIGELISDPVKNLLADIYTTSQNPVGVPSLALPCGFTNGGLPIGIQIVGKMFSEALLLKIGHCYQEKTGWHKKKPSFLS